MPLNNLLQQLLGLDPRTFAQANAAAQIGYERGIPPQDLERLYNGYLAQKDNGVAPVAQQPQNNLQSFINNRAIGGESNPDESGYARSLAAQPYKLSNSAQTDIMNAIQMAASGEGIPASMYSTLLSPSSQPNIDFTQLTVPQQNQGGWNTFRKVLGTLGTLGGTAADVISAAKGNAGPGGRASLAAGLNLLDDAAKQEEANRQANLLNELILNDQLPASNRAQIAAIARGVPQGIAQNLYPDPNEQLGKNLLNLSRAQDIYKNSPQGQADYEARLIDRQKYLEGIKSERDINKIKNISNRITELSSKPNKTQNDITTLSLLTDQAAKMTGGFTPKDRSADLKKLYENKGAVESYNQAGSLLSRINRLENLHSEMNALGATGRLGNLISNIKFKAVSEPAIAEYESLKTLMSADALRTIMNQVGTQTEQDAYRGLMVSDVKNLSVEEMDRKVGILKEFANKALKSELGKISAQSKLAGYDYVDLLKNSGALQYDPTPFLQSQNAVSPESKPDLSMEDAFEKESKRRGLK